MKNLLITATLIGSLAGIGAAPANAAPAAHYAPVGVPALSVAAPAPGPGDLTWAQAKELEKTATSEFSEATKAPAPLTKKAPESAGLRSVRPFTPVGITRCSINTGDVYKRTSGRIYPYGTVGGHPMTTCSTAMISIQQSTEIYKTVWWGLQRVAGPVNTGNMGVASLTQKSVEVICADKRPTTFRMFVRSTGRFPTGAMGTASAWEESDGALQCGTNP